MPEPELHAGMMVTPTVRLKRPLGQGGMGSVWVADHLALDTEVVVKFMSKELAANADAVARFSREAAAAARVKSPHVVQTFDHGLTSSGVPYIVMELLEGADLAAHLERRGKLPPNELIAVYTQMAKALGKAHAVGIVHRDIKPDNVFLCDGEAGEIFVKVLDFGIAKAETHLGSGTSTGQVMGTPYYMSPEQIVGRRGIDLRADIWSLGVVAFEALTGQRPFDGESVGALTLAIHSSDPPRPTSVDPSLPPAFDAWFAKSCAVDPNARFASTKEASRALVEAFGGELPAPPMSVLEPHASTAASAPVGTLLSSARAVDPPAPGSPRPRLPLVVGAIVLVAVLIGAGSLLVRATPGSSATTAGPPSNEAPSGGVNGAASGAVNGAAALGATTPALADAGDHAPVMNATAAALKGAPAADLRPAPARAPAAGHAGTLASPPKKPTPTAAPSAEPPEPPAASPAPRATPQGSDDDIK